MTKVTRIAYALNDSKTGMPRIEAKNGERIQVIAHIQKHTRFERLIVTGDTACFFIDNIQLDTDLKLSVTLFCMRPNFPHFYFSLWFLIPWRFIRHLYFYFHSIRIWWKHHSQETFHANVMISGFTTS